MIVLDAVDKRTMDTADQTEIEASYRHVLGAKSSGERAEAISQLVDDLRPLVSSIVNKRIGRGAYAARHGRSSVIEPMEELVQDLLLKIAIKVEESIAKPYDNIEAYVVTTTQRACNEFYRTLFPRRYAAEKRVLANLNHNSHFYTWQFPIGKHGALSRWPTPPQVAQDIKVKKLLEDPRSTANEIQKSTPVPEADLVQRRNADGINTAETLWITLSWSEGALRVHHLVKAVQALENDYDDLAPLQVDVEHAVDPDQETHLSQCLIIQAMWARLRVLDKRQATAILLGPLFKEAGVEALIVAEAAKASEMASLVSIDSEKFIREVMPNLPWADSEIAQFLGATVPAVRSWRWEGMAKIVKGLKEEGLG